MLEPLKQFYCDECGEIIESPKDGFVEWLQIYDEETGKITVSGFRIIHRSVKSPFISTSKEGCYKYGDNDYRMDNELTHTLKLSHQLIYSYLDLGFVHDAEGKIGSRVVDYKSFVDFAKRLTIPYYEEARKYFTNALQDGQFSDSNEIGLFSEETLKSIIETYSTSEIE